MRDKPGGNSGHFLLNWELTASGQSRIVSAPEVVTSGSRRGFPAVGKIQTTVKTKTVNALALAQFAALLEAKRTSAAAAAAAAKAAKVAAEALGLPSESVLLKSDDRSSEVAALWTERPVAAIAARVDTFHSFKVVKG